LSWRASACWRWREGRPNPIYTWTGFYIGINGGGWGRSQWDGVDTFDVSGGLIGGTVGYNWQFGGAVIGAEGDIDWSGIKGTTSVLCAPGCETRNRWLATARARIGYGFDRFLPYLINCGLNCALAPTGNVSFTTNIFRGGANLRF
jgi:hypothetical protein